ncbi:hypothetical protein C8J57DRAFT_1576499 [Mycena rebaudengoi]|nr:hypothetical protein C8J57DRAFT_1576499 [Mycena rebaudengoi]
MPGESRAPHHRHRHASPAACPPRHVGPPLVTAPLAPSAPAKQEHTLSKLAHLSPLRGRLAVGHVAPAPSNLGGLYAGMGAPAAVADVSPLSFHPSEQPRPPAARIGDIKRVATRITFTKRIREWERERPTTTNGLVSRASALVLHQRDQRFEYSHEQSRRSFGGGGPRSRAGSLQQLRRQAQYLPAFDSHPQTHPGLGLEMEAMDGYPHGIGTDLGTRSGCFLIAEWVPAHARRHTVPAGIFALRKARVHRAPTPDFAPVSAATTRCRWRELEDMRKGIGCAETRSVVQRKTARTDVRIEDLAINVLVENLSIDVLVENVAVDVHFENFGMGGGGGVVCACPRLLELKYCLFELKHRVSGIAVLDVVEGFAIKALPHMLSLRTARPDRFDSTRAPTGTSTPRAPTRFDSPKAAIEWQCSRVPPTVKTKTIRHAPSARASARCSAELVDGAVLGSPRLVVCGPRLLELKYRLLELNHRVSGVTEGSAIEALAHMLSLRNARRDGNLCTARSDGNLCNGRLIGFDSPDAAIQWQLLHRRLPRRACAWSTSRARTASMQGQFQVAA